MSEGIMFTSAGRREEGPPIGRRVLWILVVALFSLALAEIVFQVFLMPRMRIRNFDVEGDLPLTDQEVLSIAGIGAKLYYFNAKPEEIERRLASYPIVRDAQGRKITGGLPPGKHKIR